MRILCPDQVASEMSVSSGAFLTSVEVNRPVRGQLNLCYTVLKGKGSETHTLG